MKKVAIIPARGGSKRIPRKNIKEFLGKPIIAYSIEAAIQSGLFDEVMVSTDDEEIARIAKAYGANVPFLRSRRNSDDFATTADVLLEVLAQYTETQGKVFDYGCCIYPTAPFVRPEILKEGFSKIEESKFDSVFSIVAFSYSVWRGLGLNKSSGKVQMLWPEHLNVRSQDMKKVYHDAGQWYWFSVPSFKITGKIFTENSGAVELEELLVQDIDTMEDWKLAELKYNLIYG